MEKIDNILLYTLTSTIKKKEKQTATQVHRRGAGSKADVTHEWYKIWSILEQNSISMTSE